jgi:hypothetical protein
MVRIGHSQAFRTFGPIRSAHTRGPTLGWKEIGKLILETLGHLGAQSTLNVCGAHVLRRLLEARERGGKVHGPLGTKQRG